MIKFLKTIEVKYKLSLIFLLILMFFAAILEMVGISIIPVVISQLISGETNNNYLFKNLSKHFDIQGNFEFFLIITITFFLLKNFFLGFVYYLELKFVYNIRNYNAQRLFSHYLYLPFSEYSKRNSSEFIKNISIENHNGCSSIMYALVLIRESLVVSFIFLLLLFSAPEITIYSSTFLLIFFMIWVIFIRKRIYKIGEISKQSRTKFYKNLVESFNSFKEIKIFSIEGKVIKEFIKNFSLSEKHVLNESFFGKLPRLILETIVILLMSIILIFYFKNHSGKIQNNLDMLILLSIAVIRLIPSFSTLSSSFLKMRFSKPALEAIYKERLNQSKISKNKIERSREFKKIDKLRLDNISFSYDEKENVIQNLNLEIKKGDKILIEGESGSGKTTLINLISGLLKPSKGKILLNDYVEDQLLGNINIGYVSQNIYLIDESIENNIKFNSNVNDENTFNEVINTCKVSSFLNKTRNQKFIVGEAGSMLSGGQRQRIALARALYNKPDLLILDEGTSGIDPQMEKEVLNQIINKNKNMILIVISHRKIDKSIFTKKILIKKDNIQIQ